MRADQALVQRGLAPSRSAGLRLIRDGAVWVHDAGLREPVTRGARQISDGMRLEVLPSVETRYVSRAGAKLAGALAHRAFDPAGLVALDLGSSTGGFSDCLLQQGVARIVGIEVGHDQLHPGLREEPRLRNFEGINVRALDAAMLGDAMPARGFDLLVADLSFISLRTALPPALALAAQPATLLALVKPQFELGPQALDGRGIVRDPQAARELLERRYADWLSAQGWRLDEFFDSTLAGGDGNHEFFMASSS